MTMIERPMMKCGHTAQGIRGADDAPVCVPCLGIVDGADVVDAPPDLTGRKARCSYYGRKCQSETDSRTQLAFFGHRPERETDEYYCGCWGWN